MTANGVYFDTTEDKTKNKIEKKMWEREKNVFNLGHKSILRDERLDKRDSFLEEEEKQSRKESRDMQSLQTCKMQSHNALGLTGVTI